MKVRVGSKVEVFNRNEGIGLVTVIVDDYDPEGKNGQATIGYQTHGEGYWAYESQIKRVITY